MSKYSFPRLDILQSLYDLTADITPNRFVSTRPSAIDGEMNEFLLVRLPQQFYTPGDTYQFTTGQITIFARDIQGGLENTQLLEQMQSAVCAKFPIRTETFFASRPNLLYGGTDGAGFHSLIIQFNIRVYKEFDIHANI